jgi:hypothetical protein
MKNFMNPLKNMKCPEELVFEDGEGRSAPGRVWGKYFVEWDP